MFFFCAKIKDIIKIKGGGAILDYKLHIFHGDVRAAIESMLLKVTV